MAFQETIKKKKVYIPLIVGTITIIIVAVVLAVCLSGDDSSTSTDTTTPSGGTPSGGGTGNDIIDNVLTWFTEPVFRAMAPLAFAGTAGHDTCSCALGVDCGPDNEFYTYDAMVGALTDYPEFFTTKEDETLIATDDQQKRLLAAFFANVEQETGQAGAPNTMLCYTMERGFNDSGGPNDPLENLAGCGYDKAGGWCFCGRGPLQLTGISNYADFSKYYYDDDGTTLTNDPSKVSGSPDIAIAGSMWFFSNYQRGQLWPVGISTYILRPRLYQGRKRDFGLTIYLINGMYECGSNWSAGAPQHRVDAFKRIYESMSGHAWNDPDSYLKCDDLDATNDEMGIINSPTWSPAD